jgi:cobyrinic acid a,c-diamide synthase
MIAGAHSGVGKTTIVAGLIAALRRRGLSIQPFKVGPDYIDPGYHAAAAGRPCRNLDTFLVPEDRVAAMFRARAAQIDLSLIEGVMGVFDGRGYDEETGSSAAIAKLLQTPVVLTLDASRTARSAAAMAVGYQYFDPQLPLAGFIVNRVGSLAHGQGVGGAVERATGLPVFGTIPRDDRATVPERHLGLQSAAETDELASLTGNLAAVAENYLHIDRLRELADATAPLPATTAEPAMPEVVEAAAPRGKSAPAASGRDGTAATGAHPAPVIAVARDRAFHFTYEENLELLTAAGARITPFSPLTDAELPSAAAGVILSGGFPELHAAELAANTPMHQAIRRAHETGAAIYAECGGLMYLTCAIVDQQGQHPMVGLLPGQSRLSEKLTLGYRQAQALRDNWLLAAGETVPGHEFHYSRWEHTPTEAEAAFRLLPRRSDQSPRLDGAQNDSLWASYIHLHFAAKPELAHRFVNAAVAAQLRSDVQEAPA